MEHHDQPVAQAIAAAEPTAPAQAARTFGSRILSLGPNAFLGGSLLGWGILIGIMYWHPYSLEPIAQEAPEKPAEIEPPVPNDVLVQPEGSARSLDAEARHQLQVADGLLRDGSASRAMEIYAELARQRQLAEPYDVLAYRLVLAREVQGDLGKALSLYRELVRVSEDPRIIAACVLGQARIFLRTDQLDAARVLLCRALSIPSVAMSDDPDLTDEILHVLAQVDAKELLAGICQDLLSDRGCTTAEPHWSVDQLLQLVKRSEHPFVTGSAPSVAESSEVAVRADVAAGAEPIIVQHASEGRPEETILSVSLRQLPLADITTQLGIATGTKIEWSSRAAEAMRAETGSIQVKNLSLGTILDLVSISHGIVWERHDNGIIVQLDDELRRSESAARRLARAQRMLRTALVNSPAHRFAPLAHLSLGNLDFLDNDLEGASTEYRQVMQKFPTSKLNVEAAFDLAKVFLSQGRYDEALPMFYKAVDTGTGHPLRATSYAFVGRLHLEAGQIQEAVRPLMRGLSVAQDDVAQNVLAVTLAEAYLLAGNPHAANAVLMEYREALSTSKERQLAALLAALARFNAVHRAADTETPGRSLVLTVSSAADLPRFGRHVDLLVGRAMDAIGMPSAMASLYEEALKTLPPGWISEQMQDRLADHYRTIGDDSKTIAMLSALEQSKDMEVVSQATLRKADLALSTGRPDECRNSCYNLLDQPGISEQFRKDALRLLGQQYALHGDHENAALCFAGMIPAGRPAPQPIQRISPPIRAESKDTEEAHDTIESL